MPPADTPLTQRNTIKSASADGILLSVDGRTEMRAWSAVEGITAAYVPHTPGDVFILAVEFGDRMFLLAEMEPAWVEVTRLMPLHLPGVDPFEVWGAATIKSAGVYDLYEREG